MILKFLVALIPVFLYLVMLLYLDSMKLIRKQYLLMSLGWGLASAAVCYFANTTVIGWSGLKFEQYSMFVAPFVEETIKFSFLWMLIQRNKVGFMIDGAIYGFSVGAAFSFVENLFYLFQFAAQEDNLMIWIIRGFGTAVMHGGATALTAIICMSALNRKSGIVLAAIYGLLTAVVLHGVYNSFLLTPLLSTLLILLITPLTIIGVFNLNERSIRNWLELEFDSEANMLRMIRKGRFSSTKTGSYLVSVKDHFAPEVVVDLYCYISLYLELSMKAKSLIMLTEAELPVPPDPSLPAKLTELKALQKNIGKGAYLAIAPVLKMSRKDLWKFSLLRA
jgi:RsiW-degrading membrane proteinase PrsW (M82 family)